tara:strand:+ start:1117 stop:1635 length:519 start_codon:yes stop_codon:yes gene_type:complete
MRYLFFLCGLVLFLFSCSNIIFVHSQPEGVECLNEIPDRLHGMYVFEDSSFNSQSYVVTDSSVGDMVLGDNLIVKQRGNYFYLNLSGNNEYTLYVVRITKFLHEDIEISFLNITNENAHLFNILNLGEIRAFDEQDVSFKQKPDYLVDDVSVNQLNLLLNSSKKKFTLIRVD